ncbi:MAG: GNAT family N-acetyltransferase [Chloroflexi bacterium]|nr:GNAT family N-acetyltransferase [Chloroflexota bacterium]
MLQTASAYSTRSYRPEDESNVLELLKLSLGESPLLQRTPEMWQWKHLNNHFGPSLVRVACNEAGLLVGMRAFMRWEFRAGGRRVRAVRAVDTATHPDYRRMGIFANLTSQVVDDAREDGVDLIFNTPNGSSLPGYLKLGWQQVAAIQPTIKVLNYPRFALGLARHKLKLPLSSAQIAPQEFFRQEPTPVATLLEDRDAVERLLAQDGKDPQQSSGIGTQRSWEYLRWRYADHPTIPYWAVTIEDGSSLLGCAIYRTNVRFGLREIVLSELLLDHTAQNAGRELLGRLRSAVKADYLIAHFPSGSAHQRLLQDSGFRVVPGQAIDFTVRPLVSDLPKDPLCFDSWALTMGDLELF